MSEFDSDKQAAVAWVRKQMDIHGLTFDHLVEAGCFAEDHAEDADHNVVVANTAMQTAAASPRVLYRNALGQTWDGSGEYPDWLQRAVNAGQSIEFFRVD